MQLCAPDNGKTHNHQARGDGGRETRETGRSLSQQAAGGCLDWSSQLVRGEAGLRDGRGAEGRKGWLRRAARADQ